LRHSDASLDKFHDLHVIRLFGAKCLQAECITLQMYAKRREEMKNGNVMRQISVKNPDPSN
jgi:hypothetical protein